MFLTTEQKALIKEEYISYEKNQYDGKSKLDRQLMSQFFTPPELTYRMLSKVTTFEGTHIDPSCGSGSLLAAYVLLGADPEKLFGIEIDERILKVCHSRLCSPEDFEKKYGEKIEGNKFLKSYIPIDNIHQGNALNQDCFIFPESKYETDYRKGTSYNFTNNSLIGTVEFIDKNSGKSKFSFGVI